MPNEGFVNEHRNERGEEHAQKTTLKTEKKTSRKRIKNDQKLEQNGKVLCGKGQETLKDNAHKALRMGTALVCTR